MEGTYHMKVPMAEERPLSSAADQNHPFHPLFSPFLLLLAPSDLTILLFPQEIFRYINIVLETGHCNLDIQSQ